MGRLPKALREWNEKRAQSEAARRRGSKWPEIPPPDFEYTEFETAKAFGYRWCEWVAEEPLIRGRLMAHQIEASLREAYEADAASNERRGDRPEQSERTGFNAIEAWEQQVFGKGWAPDEKLAPISTPGS